MWLDESYQNSNIISWRCLKREAWTAKSCFWSTNWAIRIIAIRKRLINWTDC